MIILFNSPVKNSIAFYLLIAIVLLIYKPTELFNDDGSLVEFGTEEGTSLITYPVILFLSAILITFFFEYIKLKKYTS